jgi:hypothetical protein
VHYTTAISKIIFIYSVIWIPRNFPNVHFTHWAEQRGMGIAKYRPLQYNVLIFLWRAGTAHWNISDQGLGDIYNSDITICGNICRNFKISLQT